jgi:hypothetical protein
VSRRTLILSSPWQGIIWVAMATLSEVPPAVSPDAVPPLLSIYLSRVQGLLNFKSQWYVSRTAGCISLLLVDHLIYCRYINSTYGPRQYYQSSTCHYILTGTSLDVPNTRPSVHIPYQTHITNQLTPSARSP